MLKKVKEIYAIGTKGAAKGKKFIAIAEDGFYTLHSEELAKELNIPLNYAKTKVYAPSLEIAAELILNGGVHIRLYNHETKQRNKRKPSEVKIVWE